MGGVSSLLLMIFLAWAGQGSPSTVASTPWYRKHLVGMEVGPTGAQFGNSDPADTRYAARFDGKQIVEESIRAGAEYVVLWVRDGDYAYYDSKILPKAPGLGRRDPLREAVASAKPHGVPVIAYCVVQQGGHFLREHPEWEMVGADGKPIGRFCYRSGYLEAMKRLVAEELEAGIAGFHIDMVDQGFGPPYGCWCSTCQKEFREQFGHEMPKGASWDEGWREMLEFRYQSSQRFEVSLARYIKELRPEATVDFNYHGNPPFSFEVGQRPVQHAINGDFVTGETGVWGFSALGVSFNAEFYRATTPQTPFQVAMQRGVRMYHDQTTRPLADIRWELMTLLSHGAFVTMVDKTRFDGSLDPVAYARIGEAFAEARRKREHFGHEPLHEVGLYYSSSSRDWIGREKPAEWMQSILGAHKVCSYEHIPFSVILDENVSAEQLRTFPVVLLPNVGVLSDREVELFETYVRHGGRVIVTGHSGQFDSLGRPRQNERWEELIGAKVERRVDTLDQWFRFSSTTPADLRGDLASDWPFLVKGPATVYRPTSARGVGELMVPHRTTRQKEGREGTDWPMSADVVVGPAILLHDVGEGKVLTLAGSPDFATASEHHLVETRRLLARSVQSLHPNPRVRIQAPTHVQTVVTQEADQRILRVHLLAYVSPPQSIPSTNRPYVLPALMEENEPTYRVVMEFDRPIQEAKAWNPSTQLQSTPRRVEAILHDVHEVLIFKF
jgi:hypothetical protein